MRADERERVHERLGYGSFVESALLQVPGPNRAPETQVDAAGCVGLAPGSSFCKCLVCGDAIRRAEIDGASR